MKDVQSKTGVLIVVLAAIILVVGMIAACSPQTNTSSGIEPMTAEHFGYSFPAVLWFY
jgi:hypothetical protein